MYIFTLIFFVYLNLCKTCACIPRFTVIIAFECFSEFKMCSFYFLPGLIRGNNLTIFLFYL